MRGNNKKNNQKKVNMELIPFRIIPVDIGFKIDDKKQEIICEKLKNEGYNFSRAVRLFGENALLCVKLTSPIIFYLFTDGVGVFAFEDMHVTFSEASEVCAEKVLSERGRTHRDILSHIHECSAEMDALIDLLRSPVKERKRRFTATKEWENSGLSYVMSFYFFKAKPNIIEKKEVQDWLGNMLFTDKHTYFGEVSDSFEKEKLNRIMSNTDVLSNVHVCHSWATMIVIGDITAEQRSYYVDLEVTLQHIWLYSYITEQIIDRFLVESNKKVSSQQLSTFYDVLNDMSLIVKKYDTIISSTVHERELRLFDALKESSKLEVLKRGIEEKGSTLESKLSWAVEQKRLKSDRNTEIFIIALTILQVLSGFGLTFNDLMAPYVWPIVLLGMILIIVYRMRD